MKYRLLCSRNRRPDCPIAAVTATLIVRGLEGRGCMAARRVCVEDVAGTAVCRCRGVWASPPSHRRHPADHRAAHQPAAYAMAAKSNRNALWSPKQGGSLPRLHHLLRQLQLAGEADVCTD